MRNRIFAVFGSFLLIFLLVISSSAAEVTEYYSFYGYLRKDQPFTGPQADWQFFRSTSNTISNVITLPGKQAYHLAFIHKDTKNDVFQLFNTYRFVYEFDLDTDFQNVSLTDTRLTSSANLENFIADPYNSDYSSYMMTFSKSTYAFTHDTTTGKINLEIVLHITKENDFTCLIPFIQIVNTSDTEIVGRLKLASVEVYSDFAQENYDRLSYNLLEEIKKQLDDGFKETGEKVDDLIAVESSIAAALDKEYAADTSGLDGKVDDLNELEGDIKDQITAPIRLPDGTVIQTDDSTLAVLGEYILSKYDPVIFSTDMGHELNDFFDVFMPYIGIPITLSLTLGVILAWLSGRQGHVK